MRLLRHGDYREMPWKNGGGVTTEIAVFPRDASAFDWRVSMARVAADGGFSEFAGVDRTLSVLTGAGIELAVRGGAVRLGPDTAPHFFPGDAPAYARLIDGPILDLNVMTRRERFAHRVARLAALPTDWALAADVTLFLAFGTALRVAAGAEMAALAAGDSVMFEGKGGTVALDAAGPGDVYVIEFLEKGRGRLLFVNKKKQKNVFTWAWGALNARLLRHKFFAPLFFTKAAAYPAFGSRFLRLRCRYFYLWGYNAQPTKRNLPSFTLNKKAWLV